MDGKKLNGSINRQQHLLIVLSEECAEISKEVCKAIRFGLNDHEPGKLQTNKEKIRIEVSDFIGVLEMLINEEIIESPTRFDIESKKERVEKYLQYAVQNGSLIVE